MLLCLLACVDAADPQVGKPDDTTPTDVGDTDTTPPDDSGTTTDTDTDTDTDTTPPPPAPAVQFTGDRPVNVLLISVDTTRRDQVGLYSGLDTSPTFDAIMADGVPLMDHRTCSNWTAPSMLCAVTGRSPLDDDYWPTGVYDAYGDSRVAGIPPGLPTLASLLAAEGYATGLVTANGVFSANNTAAIVEGYQRVEIGGQAPDMNARGLRMLRGLSEAGSPWFLHLHYLDPHGPYIAPAEYAYELAELDAAYEFPWDMTNSSDVYSLMAYWPAFTPEEEALAREYLFAVYRGEIRYWDANIAALWAELDARGLLDGTLVVFYSDHGEQFGEHDQFQHGKSLNPEENRVLGGFWAKNIVPGAWEGPTLHQDLAPTVLDALGLAPNPEHTGTVVGLAPADRTRFGFCYLVGYCDPVMSVVVDNHQLIYRWDGKRFFYDVAADPAAEDDLYDADDPDVIAAWALLQPEVAGVVDRWPFLPAVDADP
jgi:arylsulfatase A-like enzyme